MRQRLFHSENATGKAAWIRLLYARAIVLRLSQCNTFPAVPII